MLLRLLLLLLLLLLLRLLRLLLLLPLLLLRLRLLQLLLLSIVLFTLLLLLLYIISIPPPLLLLLLLYLQSFVFCFFIPTLSYLSLPPPHPTGLSTDWPRPDGRAHELPRGVQELLQRCQPGQPARDSQVRVCVPLLHSACC